MQLFKKFSIGSSSSIHFKKEWTIPLVSFGLAFLATVFFALTSPKIEQPEEPKVVPAGKPKLAKGVLIYSDSLPKSSQKESSARQP